MSAEIVTRIRQAIREKHYQVTDHALEEADDDELTLDDILGVLLNGDLDSITPMIRGEPVTSFAGLSAPMRSM